jgi:hypothetical protein
MMQLNAPYRLMVTARDLVVAEGEWWDTLTDDMKKMYIKEHPDSKYAKEPIGNGTPSKPETPGKPTGQGRGQGLVKQAEQPQVPKKFGPKDQQTRKALDALPRPIKKFVDSGETKKGSKARKETATKVKSSSHTAARGVLKDAVGVVKGLNSTRNILNGKPQPGDFNKVASFVGNVLGASAMTALIGSTGPVGILTFLAVKHLAAPALYNIAKSALAKPPPAGEPGYGYWKDKNTWVPLSKKEFDNLTDEEVEHYQDTGEDKEGKFNAIENGNPKDEYGDWKDGNWVPRKSVRSSVVTATEDEQQMQKLIDAISDYADSGDIPPEAWKAAIAQMHGEQIKKQKEQQEVLDDAENEVGEYEDSHEQGT